jgi:predicted acylesterase/phospholipase RssA
VTENVTTHPSEIRNVVFEGGGVKGVAYCGALHELERSGMARQVTRVAGASAGAITAALVATGYSAEELADTMIALNFPSFEDGEPERPIRIVERDGCRCPSRCSSPRSR